MKKIKKWYIFLAIIFVSLSFLSFYGAATFKIEQKLSYSEEGNLNYKVYLKSNDDFNATYLGEDRKYIASLIDHIDIDYNYKFKGDKPMDYTFNYYILAKTAVKDNSDESKLIYENDKYLLESQKREFKGQEEASLSETVSISYDECNKIVNDFNTKYGLSGMKNNVEVSLFVELQGTSDYFESPINDKSEISLNVPLTDKTLAINFEYKDIDKKSEKVEVSSDRLWNRIFLGLGILTAFVAIVMIFRIFKSYREFSKSESKYEKNKNYILHYYSKIISNMEDFSNLPNNEFIETKEFVDLLNIRDCLNKPILFLEIEKGKESWFMVVDDKTVYRYLLKENEDSKK